MPSPDPGGDDAQRDLRPDERPSHFVDRAVTAPRDDAIGASSHEDLAQLARVMRFLV